MGWDVCELVVVGKQSKAVEGQATGVVLGGVVAAMNVCEVRVRVGVRVRVRVGVGVTIRSAGRLSKIS